MENEGRAKEGRKEEKKAVTFHEDQVDCYDITKPPRTGPPRGFGRNVEDREVAYQGIRGGELVKLSVDRVPTKAEPVEPSSPDAARKVESLPTKVMIPIVVENAIKLDETKKLASPTTSDRTAYSGSRVSIDSASTSVGVAESSFAQSNKSGGSEARASAKKHAGSSVPQASSSTAKDGASAAPAEIQPTPVYSGPKRFPADSIMEKVAPVEANKDQVASARQSESRGTSRKEPQPRDKHRKHVKEPQSDAKYAKPVKESQPEAKLPKPVKEPQTDDALPIHKIGPTTNTYQAKLTPRDGKQNIPRHLPLSKSSETAPTVPWSRSHSVPPVVSRSNLKKPWPKKKVESGPPAEKVVSEPHDKVSRTTAKFEKYRTSPKSTSTSPKRSPKASGQRASKKGKDTKGQLTPKAAGKDDSRPTDPILTPTNQPSSLSSSSSTSTSSSTDSSDQEPSVPGALWKGTEPPTSLNQSWASSLEKRRSSKSRRRETSSSESTSTSENELKALSEPRPAPELPVMSSGPRAPLHTFPPRILPVTLPVEKVTASVGLLAFSVV